MKRRISFAQRQVRARPLACFAVCFLLGLIATRRLRPPLIACIIACVVLLTLALALKLVRRRGAAAIIMLLAFALGMTRMTLAQHAFPVVETRYSSRMTGKIVSEPYTNRNTGRVISQFQLDSVDGEPIDMKVRLYLRGDEESLSAVRYGQTLNLTGHIWKPDPVTNPWEFDFGEFLRRDGMAAYATAKIEDVQILEAHTDFHSLVIGVRQAVSSRIDRLFPENAAMVRALVLGDRSLLSDEMRDAMNKTGTAHLISISGLHVTVLSAMLALLLGLFLPRRWANALTLVFLIPYGALVGFNPPFVRAFLMFALFSLAPIAALPSDPITRLCAAMLVYLMAKPMDVTDAGFVLSYSASAGILLLMPPLMSALGIRRPRERKPPAGRAMRWLRTASLFLPTLLCASLAAQLATIPAVVAWFGVQSIVSLPFNLVCVPLCMLGYLCAVAALVLSLFSLPLAAMASRVPDRLFTALSIITRWSFSLPQTGVRVGRYPWPLILAHAGLLLAASELSKIRLKWRKVMPLLLIVVAGLSALVTFARAWPFSIVFLDAGQADCAVVRYHGHTWLVDAGDDYTPATDYLSATCLRLDGVVLSHPHEDHAGGLVDVLTAFRPEKIVIPSGWYGAETESEPVINGINQAEKLGIPIAEVSSGDHIALAEALQMTVYSPDACSMPDSVNDLSLMALISCEGHSALFTGDLSREGEPAIIPDADILKVAHHGSNKATSDRFLAECTPQIAVVSVGENNYGHPSDETLERLEAAGAAVYQTRECGAITLTLRRGVWHVDTFLEAEHELE